jgi:hypothetical protein
MLRAGPSAGADQAEAACAAGALLVEELDELEELEVELADFSEEGLDEDDDSALTLDLSPARLSVR